MNPICADVFIQDHISPFPWSVCRYDLSSQHPYVSTVLSGPTGINDTEKVKFDAPAMINLFALYPLDPVDYLYT